ncbi:hypothetical protein XENOCAPTIV_001580, partial [Xenoophorus captivus]
ESSLVVVAEERSDAYAGQLGKKISVFKPLPLLQNWEKTLASLDVDRTVGEPQWAKPGSEAGMAMLESFIDVRLKLFATQRNDPNMAALSQLSPWIRFGQLSAQRVALQVRRCGKNAGESVAAFIEELVVRRELTDNFCFYNEKYDKVEGQWVLVMAILQQPPFSLNEFSKKKNRHNSASQVFCFDLVIFLDSGRCS